LYTYAHVYMYSLLNDNIIICNNDLMFLYKHIVLLT